MSGGPEQIRARVEARKAELQRLADAELQRSQEEQQRKTDEAKKVAQERLAELEQAAAAKAAVAAAESPRPAADDIDENLVGSELDKLIRSRANDRWSTSENATFAVTLFGGFIFLFIAWPIGLSSIGFSMIYAYARQQHYSGLVRQELGL